MSTYKKTANGKVDWIKLRPTVAQYCADGRTSGEIIELLGLVGRRTGSLSGVITKLGLNDTWRDGRNARKLRESLPAQSHVVRRRLAPQPENTAMAIAARGYTDGLTGVPTTCESIFAFFESIGVSLKKQGNGFLLRDQYLPNRGYLVAHANLYRTQQVRCLIRLEGFSNAR